MQVAWGTSIHTGHQRLPICIHAESVNLQAPIASRPCLPIYIQAPNSPHLILPIWMQELDCTDTGSHSNDWCQPTLIWRYIPNKGAAQMSFYIVGWPNTFCFSLEGCCAAHAKKALPAFFSKQLTIFMWYLPVYIWTCLFKYKHVLNMGTTRYYFNHKTHHLWQILSPGLSFTCLLCLYTKMLIKTPSRMSRTVMGIESFLCFQIKTQDIRVWTRRTQEDTRNI
jgi:hypothetical protein